MSYEAPGTAGGQPFGAPTATPANELLHKDFAHLKAHWWWFLLLGILLTICGTAAVVFPALSIVTTFAAVIILGITLIVAGTATIITSFWAGKTSGQLLQLLVGIAYIIAGFMITDKPVKGALTITALIAAFFIVIGLFRIVAAFVVRFPHWGWAILNGAMTFLIGVVIYRHFPLSSLWVIGLLVGLEMLFHGWTWIMLSLAIKNIPEKAA